MRQRFARFIDPVARRTSGVRSAARFISRSPRHGVKLLFNCRSEPRLQFQPDVYPFAAYLGERFGCTHAIAIGSPTAKDLKQLFPQFVIIGFVPSASYPFVDPHKRYCEIQLRFVIPSASEESLSSKGCWCIKRDSLLPSE